MNDALDTACTNLDGLQKNPRFAMFDVDVLYKDRDSLLEQLSKDLIGGQTDDDEGSEVVSKALLLYTGLLKGEDRSLEE